MNLNKILEEWKEDSQLESNYLDESSRLTPFLHSKYLELLSNAKLQLKQAEYKQKSLMKKKWLWYNGKLSQQEVEELGWDPDPFDGLKILKGEMEHYVNADPELVESQAKIDYLTTVIDTLKEILSHITWRHQTIKNMIDWRKFESGV
jgi:hypothetical protein